MPLVRLIHWKQSEAIERAAALRAMGYAVNADLLEPAGGMKLIRDEPPAAVVIDLTRLPSHGKAAGFALRQQKATRGIPLVFVDGDAAKVNIVRNLLPDATFTSWPKLERDLRKAISNPPRDPLAPKSPSGGYSGTPLPKKLGIKEGATVGLIGAPKDFEKTLGPLPPDVIVKRESRLPKKCDVVLCFAVMKKDLQPRMKRAMNVSADSGLWLIWPKKSSGVTSDLSEDVVRTMGLDAGWVDFKVCAIDATWSGHRFAKRKRT